MMVEAGHFAICLAVVCALLQATALPLSGALKRPALAGLASLAAVVQAVAMVTAMAALIHAFAVSDFSVRVVVENSHTAKPMIYKIAAAWGHHEGSLLLWATMLALFGGLTAVWQQKLEHGLWLRLLTVQGALSFGVLGFVVLTSNPFDRVWPAPMEGFGLNPLLQDPGLAWHPPLLYVGTVGVSVAFAFAVAGLWHGRLDPAWARAVRGWTLLAWTFLTVGIAWGSEWAYAELGWGGWWFWDPVENSALMPWLVATALLHAVGNVERRQGLQAWVVLLAILGFAFSLLGMFLVRSGVLTSVHAFAADPLRGVYILGLFGIIVGGALALFAMRAADLKNHLPFAVVSRGSALMLNTVLLIVVTGVTLFGTLYPLLAEALELGRISVGAPFFNATVLPLMLPVFVLMAIAPLARQAADNWRRLAPMTGMIAGAGLAVGAGFAAFGVWAAIGFGLAAMITVGTAVMLWQSRTGLTRRRLAMGIAHFGVAVALAGMTGASQMASEAIGRVAPGESVTVAGHEFTLRQVSEVPGPNYIALRGVVEVSDGSQLQPEVRRYASPPQTTTEAAIATTLLDDTYAVIGDASDGKVVMRVFHKPLVVWIWAGAALMAFAGLLALSPRRRRT
jgi:cytochrome c-type biogenesis protein CcmF